MSSPILTTKLYIPPPRSEFVPRPRLMKQLDTMFYQKLTLVSAPAGFGKTTLVSSWIYDLQLKTNLTTQTDQATIISEATASTIIPILPQGDVKFAWLSLDEADNDLNRFLNYFVAAIQQVEPELGQNLDTLLQSPQLPSIEILMTTLINELVAKPTKLVIVLDDYHVIEQPQIDRALIFLLDHLPRHTHLLIITRVDPSFPLSRLRARSQLNEIRIADLRFTHQEVNRFLNQVTPSFFSDEHIAMLEQQTEGWIAGLQLAVLSIRSSNNSANFVANFTTNNRYIIDYLADEVLDQQSSEIKEFLLQTSILNQLSAPLCNAITQQKNSEVMLRQLETANLFLIPLDNQRQWYRYHHLFAELLQQRLQHQMPTEITALHQRAAQWYQAELQDFQPTEWVTQALYHYLTINDFASAAPLIGKHAAYQLRQGNITIVKQWLDQLPIDLIKSSAGLIVFKGWVLFFSQRHNEAEEYIALAEQNLPEFYKRYPKATNLIGHINLLKGWILHNQGHSNAAINLFEKTLAKLTKEEHQLERGLTLNFMSGVFYDLGDIVRTEQCLSKGVIESRTAKNYLAMLTGIYWLSHLYQEQGKLSQAQLLLEQTLQWIDEANLHHLPSMAELYLGYSQLLYEKNEITKAKDYLQKSIAGTKRGLTVVTLFCEAFVHTARLSVATGDIENAQNYLEQAKQIMQNWQRSSITQDMQAIQIDVWLMITTHPLANVHQRQQASQTIQQWYQTIADQLQSPFTFSALTERFVMCRYLIAQLQQTNITKDQSCEQIKTVLGKIEQLTSHTNLKGWLIKVYIQQAILLVLQGLVQPAINRLSQAIVLAEPEGYCRIFINEGKIMATLLQQAYHQGVSPIYIQHLLASFPNEQASLTGGPTMPLTPSTSLLIEPLSDRELELLQLVATGLSNRDIAKKLYLAVSTVKRHMSNIYGKLGVNSRTQAVAKANELGLI